MTVEQDRAADRRILLAFGLMTAVEIVLAVLADAGVYPLWAWLVLAVGAVLAGGLAWALVQRRTEGAPLWGSRTRPPVDRG